jgi:hypothetical protein
MDNLYSQLQGVNGRYAVMDKLGAELAFAVEAAGVQTHSAGRAMHDAVVQDVDFEIV